MSVLEGEKVTRYFGGLAAVVNVDFHINEGEIVGLIGPNGAGKTTLFNLISGAVPVSSGTIKFQGDLISNMKPHEICHQGIARTFQAGNLFPKLTVLENVILGALFGKSSSAQSSASRNEAKKLLALVGLEDKANFRVRDLTLAAQKRLEIARAMATKPKLLMLDEVMAGLTPTEVMESLELIRKIRNGGVTIFLIEHVMKAIMGISERIIVLHHGEKIAEGTPQQICTNAVCIKVYLGE